MIAARNALQENAEGASDSRSVERLMRTRSMWKAARKHQTLSDKRWAISIWATEHLKVYSVHSPLQLVLISTNSHLPLQGEEITRAASHVDNEKGGKMKCMNVQCNSFTQWKNTSCSFLMEFYLNPHFIHPALRMQSTDVCGAHKNCLCLQLHRVPLKTSTQRVLWRKWHERRCD